MVIFYETLDLSALDAIISALLPGFRQDFELRRKQSTFRAISQLKGAAANIIVATILLLPADDGKHANVIWLFGLLSLRCLGPDASARSGSAQMGCINVPRISLQNRLTALWFAGSNDVRCTTATAINIKHPLRVYDGIETAKHIYLQCRDVYLGRTHGLLFRASGSYLLHPQFANRISKSLVFVVPSSLKSARHEPA